MRTTLALARSSRFPAPAGPLVQVILDGIGVAPAGPGNAVSEAYTPTLDRLLATDPHLVIQAHGRAVGLPSDDDMGNSEVGHNALGAGRVFDQGAMLVNAALASGSLVAGAVFQDIVRHCAAERSALHLIGLLSDGNVHSHIDQLLALIAAAAQHGIARLRVHPLTDGRDVGERTALGYLERLEAALAEQRAAGRDYLIASGGGRMLVTMDRYEADWRIVERGWRAHVHGDGRRFGSAAEAVRTYYAEDPAVNDQFLPAFVVAGADGQPVGPIRDGDAVIFFNFRGDRALEITRAFEDEVFDKFDRGRRPRVLYAGLMQYDGDLLLPKRFLVAPPAIAGTLGERLAASGVSQFACAETQKFGHVTYFWNGNRSGKFDEALETYVEVPSDRVPFEQRPWMKAAEVTDALLAALARSAGPAGQAGVTEGGRARGSPGGYRYLRVNFANGDMVGHSGHLAATRTAVQAVDLCLARVVAAVEAAGGVLVVTADHGNADDMFMRDKKGQVLLDASGQPQPRTAHSLNPVWYVLHDPARRWTLRRDVARPGLANNAASIANLLGYEAPGEWLESLVVPA